MSRDPLERGRIDEEIRFHLEERARELEARGMDPAAAREEARRLFGDPDAVVGRLRREAAEDRRTSPGSGLLAGWGRDVRFALRALRRRPGFAAAAILTLALGIGANAAIFGVVDGVFLGSPPVSEPDRLVAVYTTCSDGAPRCSSSYPDLLDYRRAESLRGLAGYSWLPVSVGGDGEPARFVTAMLVTGNYFDVLGVRPARGRVVQPADDDPGAPAPVAVLSHDAWTGEFGSDPGVVDRTLRFNGTPFRVVGVAPPGFRGTALGGDPDLFIPMTAGSLLGVGSVSEEGVLEERGHRWIDALVGRLAPGASVESARAELGALGRSLAEAYPERWGEREVTVESAGRYTLPQFGREELARLVWILAGVVGLTLLLACANVANLLLARAAARSREMGMRVALGAGRRRILRQLLTESVVLAVLGGLGGLAVAEGLLAILVRFPLPGGVSLALLDVGTDARVFGFALALSLATGLVFGAVPGLHAGRTDVVAALRGRRGRGGGGGGGPRGLLLAVQVALCLVLLAGSGMFLSSLRAGLGWDLGIEEEGLAAVRVDFGVRRYEPSEALERLDAILAGVRRIPGVRSAAASSKVPLQSGGNLGFAAEIDGYVPGPGEEVDVELALATPGLFGTLGTPMLAGRGVSSADGPGDEAVAVVNRTMADAYWPRGGAVGGLVTLSGAGQRLRVVGVAEDVAWRTVPQPPLGFVVVPLRQFPEFATSQPVTITARTTGDAGALLPALRRVVHAADPDLPVLYLSTMEDLLAATLAPQRLGALVLSAFATLALLLAAVGIAGVVAFVVGRRKREIGIRLALGASGGRELWRTVRSVTVPLVAGAAAGLGVAALLRPAASAFMVEAGGGWGLASAGSVLLLGLVGVAAALVPARAATRVDPVTVLREE